MNNDDSGPLRAILKSSLLMSGPPAPKDFSLGEVIWRIVTRCPTTFASLLRDLMERLFRLMSAKTKKQTRIVAQKNYLSVPFKCSKMCLLPLMMFCCRVYFSFWIPFYRLFCEFDYLRSFRRCRLFHSCYKLAPHRLRLVDVSWNINEKATLFKYGT